MRVLWNSQSPFARKVLSQRFPELVSSLEGAIDSLYETLGAELGASDYFAGDFSRAVVAARARRSTPACAAGSAACSRATA